MRIYDIANVFTGFIETVILFKLYNAFCGRTEKFSATIYTGGIIAIAIIINICNVYFSYGILNAVGMLVAFLVPSFLFKGKIIKKMLIALLTIALIGIIEIMVMFSIMLIFNLPVEEAVGNPLYRMLGIIVSKMLTLFIVNITCVKFKKENYYIGTSYWALFLLMFSTTTIAVFLIFKLSFDTDDVYMHNLSVVCSFGLLFSTYFALYLYEHVAKQADIIKNQEQQEQHLKQQIKHLDDILVTQKQIKKFKHDFNNFLIGLQSYIDDKNLIGAQNYLKKLRDTARQGRNIIETGNPVLDAILSTKIAIAESKGITVNTQIQIPSHISVDSVDICSIFGNAIDNAIEACERSNLQDKKISIIIACREQSILCKIVNTASESDSSQFGTSKEDKQNHGFGLENIKAALSKYDAYPTIEKKNNEFTLKFVIFAD